MNDTYYGDYITSVPLSSLLLSDLVFMLTKELKHRPVQFLLHCQLIKSFNIHRFQPFCWPVGNRPNTTVALAHTVWSCDTRKKSFFAYRFSLAFFFLSPPPILSPYANLVLESFYVGQQYVIPCHPFKWKFSQLALCCSRFRFHCLWVFFVCHHVQRQERHCFKCQNTYQWQKSHLCWQ